MHQSSALTYNKTENNIKRGDFVSFHRLSHIPIGTTATVTALHSGSSIRRRLLDIGLTEGARVTCLYAAPSGDPRAYLIRSAVIALRSEEAETIEVKKEDSAWA